MFNSLSDGDIATVSDLAARRRALTTVTEAEVEMAYRQNALRAQLVTDFYAARAAGDLEAVRRVLIEAADHDAEQATEPSLIDELTGYRADALTAVA
jgi:hypothetical protein